MQLHVRRHVRRIAFEGLGWALVLVGIAALVLPGPGLLALFAGLAILSQQYTWAERRVEPVKEKALETAEAGVRTWWRLALSLLGAIWLAAIGIVWGLRPPAPGWWPLRESWWLVGGWATGATLIFSALVVVALMGYSIQRFGGPGQHRPHGPDLGGGAVHSDHDGTAPRA